MSLPPSFHRIGVMTGEKRWEYNDMWNVKNAKTKEEILKTHVQGSVIRASVDVGNIEAHIDLVSGMGVVIYFSGIPGSPDEVKRLAPQLLDRVEPLKCPLGSSTALGPHIATNEAEDLWKLHNVVTYGARVVFIGYRANARSYGIMYKDYKNGAPMSPLTEMHPLHDEHSFAVGPTLGTPNPDTVWYMPDVGPTGSVRGNTVHFVSGRYGVISTHSALNAKCGFLGKHGWMYTFYTPSNTVDGILEIHYMGTEKPISRKFNLPNVDSVEFVLSPTFGYSIMKAGATVDEAGRSYGCKETYYLLDVQEPVVSLLKLPNRLNDWVRIAQDGQSISWVPHNPRVGPSNGMLVDDYVLISGKGRSDVLLSRVFPADTPAGFAIVCLQRILENAYVNTVNVSPSGEMMLVGGFGNMAGDAYIFYRPSLRSYHPNEDLRNGVYSFEANQFIPVNKLKMPCLTLSKWSPDDCLLYATTQPRMMVDNSVTLMNRDGEIIFEQKYDSVFDATITYVPDYLRSARSDTNMAPKIHSDNLETKKQYKVGTKMKKPAPAQLASSLMSGAKNFNRQPKGPKVEDDLFDRKVFLEKASSVAKDSEVASPSEAVEQNSVSEAKQPQSAQHFVSTPAPPVPVADDAKASPSGASDLRKTSSIGATPPSPPKSGIHPQPQTRFPPISPQQGQPGQAFTNLVNQMKSPTHMTSDEAFMRASQFVSHSGLGPKFPQEILSNNPRAQPFSHPTQPQTQTPQQAIPSHLFRLQPVQWEYIDTSGQVRGPFDQSQMRKWHRQGYFSPSLKIRCVGTVDWGTLTGFFPHLETAFL